MPRWKKKKPSIITPELIEEFSNSFLVSQYDGSLAIPDIHREWWDICTDADRLVAIAAPRGHAKTTAITVAYTLCNLMFRVKKHVVIIGNNEDTAIGHLAHIRNEIAENADLRDVFDIAGFDKEGATEIIVRFKDGHRFRVLAKGAKQKVRGINWNHSRPDLVIIDDLEDDEAVLNKERRDSLRDWVLTAVLPGLSRAKGQIRFIGTILHEDSMLMTAINSRAWRSALYKAHKSYDVFEELLWPELWSIDALKEMRQVFMDTGNPEGYSQEFLNDPSDLRNSFFRLDDLIPMDKHDRQRLKSYYVGGDFALSDKTYSDHTVFVVGGYDSDGVLHIVDVQSIRTDDTNLIVEMLFGILEAYSPEYFIWEQGTLANAIGPVFEVEMQRRNKFTTVETFPAVQDKRLRAVPVQQRMRAGGVRVDVEADWYAPFREQLRKFPKGKENDAVDALAWLGRGIAEFVEAPTDEEIEEDEWQHALDEAGLDWEYTGTGY